MKQCNIFSEEDYSYAAATTMYRYHTHSSDINIPCVLQELQKLFIIITKAFLSHYYLLKYFLKEYLVG